jgi:hypothetical protein
MGTEEVTTDREPLAFYTKGKHVRRTAMALSTVALVGVLGACAQQGSTSTSPDNTPAAPKLFSDVTSMATGTDSVMEQKKSVTLTIQDASGARILPGLHKCQVDITKTSMSCNSGPTSTVVTPDAMYMKIPQYGADPSKPWIKVSADTAGQLGAPLSASTQGIQGIKRLADFKLLLPTGTTIASTSQDQVNGQTATRYDTVTDVSQAAAQADPSVKQWAQGLLNSGVKQTKQSIWIDSDGLPLKTVSTVPLMTIDGGKQKQESTSTVTYQDWGKPMTITVPPADQITEWPK